MTLVLAISGVGNTGKTSVIRGVKKNNEIVAKGLQQVFEEMGLSYKIYDEAARKVIMEHGNNFDMQAIQEEIANEEIERAADIKIDVQSGLYDVIVCDRTRVDNVVYSFFNFIKGKMKDGVITEDLGDLYDEIVLLKDPIKDTGTKGLTHYNSDEFIAMFNAAIATRFPDYTGFSNAKKDMNDIIDFVKSKLE